MCVLNWAWQTRIEMGVDVHNFSNFDVHAPLPMEVTECLVKWRWQRLILRLQ